MATVWFQRGAATIILLTHINQVSPLTFSRTQTTNVEESNLFGVDRRRFLRHTGATAAAATLALPASAIGTPSPVTKLSDGTSFPLCSFGLQIYDNDTAKRLTQTAIEVGYRNFFASVLTGNQKGFAEAVKASPVDRTDLFICGSVVSNRARGFEAAYASTTSGWKQNMKQFANGNIDYLDQIMLDYPGPDVASIQGQWKAFEEMHDQGLVKTLSVSNFNAQQLDAVLEVAKVKPVVNQLPYSVAYHEQGTVEENSKRGLLVQAWAPLGKSLGGRFSSSIKGKCADIGKQYGKSWAQVALRWILQSGASFTTQSQSREHFTEDLELFDFELSPADMAILSTLA